MDEFGKQGQPARPFIQRYYEDSRPLWENGGLAYDPVILSGAIGTHLGPGAVGVAFFAPQ